MLKINCSDVPITVNALKNNHNIELHTLHGEWCGI